MTFDDRLAKARELVRIYVSECLISEEEIEHDVSEIVDTLLWLGREQSRRPTTFGDYVQSYLDTIEWGTERTVSMDSLSEDDQRRAKMWMKSMEDAQGIDPYAKRPSTVELLKRAEELKSLKIPEEDTEQ